MECCLYLNMVTLTFQIGHDVLIFPLERMATAELAKGEI
jgi:hypothetical protein